MDCLPARECSPEYMSIMYHHSTLLLMLVDAEGHEDGHRKDTLRRLGYDTLWQVWDRLVETCQPSLSSWWGGHGKGGSD